MSERRIIRPSETPLLASDVLVRTESTLQIVDRVCKYPPWNNIIDQAILFGSLARNEGYSGSDVDVAFLTGDSSVTSIKDYLEVATKLMHTVNKCKEILRVPLLINPFFVLKTWYEPGSHPYVIPAVLEAIKNEGIPIWP